MNEEYWDDFMDERAMNIYPASNAMNMGCCMCPMNMWQQPMMQPMMQPMAQPMMQHMMPPMGQPMMQPMQPMMQGKPCWQMPQPLMEPMAQSMMPMEDMQPMNPMMENPIMSNPEMAVPQMNKPMMQGKPYCPMAEYPIMQPTGGEIKMRAVDLKEIRD